MPVIYEPRGKALEYSPLACNLYTGCSHACKYCYCPAIMRKTLAEWSSNPYPRTRIIKQVEKDAQKLNGDKREILFSFMSDPYQSEEAAFLTRQALNICEKYNLTPQVLTKAGFRTVKDFDILKKNHWKFGSTIIFRTEEMREEWEPGAPSISSRYEAVKIANKMGIYTWVSIEPVIDTEEALKVIGDLLPFVDFWKIGKLNHFKEIENKIDWKQYLKDAEKLLTGKKYYIKKDLLKYKC